MPVTRVTVLPDGTYSTQTTYTTDAGAIKAATAVAQRPPLRALLLAGDFFVAASLASTLVKLTLRYQGLSSVDPASKNRLHAEVRLSVPTKTVGCRQAAAHGPPFSWPWWRCGRRGRSLC